MKKIILGILFLFLLMIKGQEIPQVKVDDKEKAIQLMELNVKTDIIGNVSQTTYEMLFYNPNDRVLEGELIFPLEEGQTVIGYALDINGNMRDAVVVERQKARQAFENTIRRKIDPALLEQSEGNNYKSRIYPLPAKGVRKIKITFEQELLVKNKHYYLEIPLQYEDIENFNLKIEVFKQKEKPIVHHSKMNFNKWEESYILKHHEENFTSDEVLQIEIPTVLLEERILSYEDFIYINKNIKKQSRLKQKPSEINVYWDVSLSQQQKDFTKEIELLESYLQTLKHVKVNLIIFSEAIVKKKSFTIENGRLIGMKEMLSTIPYDGATSFSNKIFKYNGAEEVIIFTNGIFNFKKENIAFKTPVYIVNSGTVANHVENNRVAQATGGRYINLNRFSGREALEQLLNEPYRFLGYKADSKMEESFPIKGAIVNENFTFVGKSKNISEVTLLFGYGKEVINEYKIKIDKQNENPLVKRIWAKKKLTELRKNNKENKQEIISHSLDNQLITSYTSLIVLDRLEDYLRYEIVPPMELQEEYYAQINRKKEMQKEEQENIKKLRSELQSQYKIIKDWWMKDFHPFKKKTKSDSLGHINNIIPPSPPEVMAFEELEEVVEEIVIGYSSQSDANKTLSGQVQGAIINKPSVVKIRGMQSIEDTQPLYIVNGKVVSGINQFSPNDISSIEVLKGASAVAIYGSRGINGVMVVTTKKSVNVPEDIVLGKEEDLNIKNKRSESYLNELEKSSNLKEAYTKYLLLRENQEQNPLFYVDVANYFYEEGNVEQAVKIISNVLELKLDDSELIRLVAYTLESYGLYEEALIVYKKLLELRSEDIQTHRDVALAYENVKDYQKAFDSLVTIIEGGLIKNDTDRRFEGVEQIAFVEAIQLLTNHKDKINTIKKVKPLPVDIRIVMDWNHDNVDIDLWVEDPNGEVCKYDHAQTEIGGRISNDMTAGFGPEEFMLKKAIKGTYKIYTNYYGTSSQKISGPVTIKVTMFKNYGKSNQTRETKITRLKDAKSKKVLLGEMGF